MAGDRLAAFAVLQAAAGTAAGALRCLAADEEGQEAAQELPLAALCHRVLDVVDGGARSAAELGHFEPLVEEVGRGGGRGRLRPDRLSPPGPMRAPAAAAAAVAAALAACP